MRGTLNATLIAHKKLANIIKEWKLIISLCGLSKYIALVDDMRTILVFHANNLLLSQAHYYGASCAKKLDGKHRSKDPPSVTRGKLRECLGISLDFGATRITCAIYECNFIKKFRTILLEILKSPNRIKLA